MQSGEGISEKEKRIRLLTNIYYSKKEVQDAILEFAKNREVVPRYFEGFGKRPDVLTYPSDVVSLVKKGATSFHCSEELWKDPLQISSDMVRQELDEIRIGWDLLIDVDSPFFEYSKKATLLLADELERHGVKNYGIKFSGSKGFHIIVSGKAFPKEFDKKLTKEMFPEWARTICQYLEARIRNEFNVQISTEEDIKNLETRTKKKREELVESVCPNCGSTFYKDILMMMKCKLCENITQQKKSVLEKKRVFRCNLDNAPLEVIEEKEILECPNCKTSNFKMEISAREQLSKEGRIKSESYTSEIRENIKQKESGGFDLVLVAPRHLFRMPYSLHEKTSLASVVLSKNEIEKFTPMDASPMHVKVRLYIGECEIDEGKKLLSDALEWKTEKDAAEKKIQETKYSGKKFEETSFENVSEEMFPPAINKLLEGLEDGKKRGLFILITFLRSLNFSYYYVNKKVREWNEKNKPPMKEGYIKSQVDWHFKQKKKILPPNYNNEGFYKDLGLIKEMPKTKNPIADVARKIRERKD